VAVIQNKRILKCLLMVIGLFLVLNLLVWVLASSGYDMDQIEG
jgi:hypothetical protein